MDPQERRQKEGKIWNQIAGSYDRNVMGVFQGAYAQSIQRCAALFSADQQVLEIGCGTGIISLGIAAGVQRVVGLDLCAPMIELARAKAAEAGVKNVEFRVQDGYELPFADGEFDGVLLFNTLHALQDPLAVLQEARRVLKPGSWLATATDCYADPAPLGLRIKLTAQTLLHRLGIIPVLHNYRREDLLRLVEQAGFEGCETAVLHPAPVNFYLAARKSA